MGWNWYDFGLGYPTDIPSSRTSIRANCGHDVHGPAHGSVRDDGPPSDGVPAAAAAGAAASNEADVPAEPAEQSGVQSGLLQSVAGLLRRIQHWVYRIPINIQTLHILKTSSHSVPTTASPTTTKLFHHQSLCRGHLDAHNGFSTN